VGEHSGESGADDEVENRPNVAVVVAGAAVQADPSAQAMMTRADATVSLTPRSPATFLLEDGLGHAAEQRVTRPEVVGRRPRRQLRLLVDPAVGQSLQALGAWQLEGGAQDPGAQRGRAPLYA
jgi:hypothetical protein